MPGIGTPASLIAGSLKYMFSGSRNNRNAVFRGFYIRAHACVGGLCYPLLSESLGGALGLRPKV